MRRRQRKSDCPVHFALEVFGDPSREASGGYRLTPKGIDLLPLMMEIIGWTAKHDPRTAADRGFVRRLRADRDGFAKQLRAGLRAAHVVRRPAEGPTK